MNPSKKITKFEDLIAWQKARELTKTIYLITARGLFYKDFALRDQIRKASISVMSNLAEGFERNSKREFLRFISIAKASCAEVRSQLYIACDAGYISESKFYDLMALAAEDSRIIGGLRVALKNKLNTL